jgi:ribose transport system substrate-binding protein
MAVPAGLPVTTPLRGKPQPGKTFVWFTCDIPACTVLGSAIKQAVQSVGWTYQQIPFTTANPASLVSAMKQALQYHPSYAGITALPEALWQSMVPRYAAAGVKIITVFNDTPVSGPVIGNVAGETNAQLAGRNLANYVIADSGGKADILLQRVDDLPALKDIADGFAATITKNCGDCKLTTVANTLAQAQGAQVVTSVISALQRNSGIDYLMSPHAQFIDGILSALGTAGLSGKVKIVAAAADSIALTGVKQGQFAAVTGNPLNYAAWQTVDLALRSAEGMAIPAEGYLVPLQLLTRQATFQLSNSQDVPLDYQELFKKIWLVG